MYEQDNNSYALTKSSHSRKKKNKKITQTISSDMLGFIPPSSQSQQQYIPRPRPKRKQTHKRQTQRKFNFRNKHHFVLQADSISEQQILKFQGITPLEWEKIKQVIFTVSFNHPITCPICLNGTSEITDPYITACGHVFCSPCILRHVRVCNCLGYIAKKQLHCPVCNQFVGKNELKPCVLLGYKPIGDNKLSFVLRIRPHGVNTIFNTQTLHEDFNFSKFIRATYEYFLEELYKQKMVLENHMKQYLSEGEQQNIPYITEAMDLVNEKILGYKLQLSYHKKKNKIQQIFQGKHYTTMKEQLKSKSFYFYQEQYGRLIFLHPICNHYLCEQFLSNDQLPLIINSSLEYKQSIEIEPKTLRRYKYLNHLPLDSQILFAQINMSSFLQKATLDEYNKEMNRHKQRIRQRQQQDSRRNDQIINKRLSKKLAKQIAKEKYQYVTVPVDDEIKDLKSCNKDENFPQLPSEPRLVEQMSEPIPTLVLKEPLQNISHIEFEFPQINMENIQKVGKKGKGKKGKKYEQVDITQMMFQPPESEL